jgi:hypothetical protein
LHYRIANSNIVQQSARIATWILVATIIVLSVVPPGLRPQTGAPHALEYLAIFSATGLAASLGYQRKHISLAILLVIFAAFVEIIQLFVPGRHARFSDFAVDAFAAIFGLMITML